MGGEAPPQASAPPQRAPSDPGQHGTSQGKARVTGLPATASVPRAIGVPTYRYPDDSGVDLLELAELVELQDDEAAAALTNHVISAELEVEHAQLVSTHGVL